jgi:hypothetical protein
MGGFMVAVRFGRYQLGLLFATALALLMQPSASHAYTQEEQAACSGDAFRLCGSEIPDVDRVTACMVAKKSQLSPGCRAYFRPGPEDAASAPVGRSMSTTKPVTARKKVTAKSRKTRKHKKPNVT